jgi:hypothetical protein
LTLTRVGIFTKRQEAGLGDYFLSCLRADIDGLRVTAGIHKMAGDYYRWLSRVFPHGIFYTLDGESTETAGTGSLELVLKEGQTVAVYAAVSGQRDSETVDYFFAGWEDAGPERGNAGV